MQTMTWLDEEIEAQFSNCPTLRDVIQQLEGQAWEEGHVVCEVRINGIHLTEKEEQQFGDASSKIINSLEILTRTPEELVQEALTSYQDFLPEIKQMSIECSEKFREQDSQQFTGVLEGCRWFTDAIVLLKNNVEAWGQNSPKDYGWQECEVNYTQVVKGLLVAFEAQDYSLVADLLEYELTNCLDGWLELFENMSLK